MMDFTDLLNRGHRRYIDKYLRPRRLGRCDGCNHYALLIQHLDPVDKDFSWELCHQCYEKIITREV